MRRSALRLAGRCSAPPSQAHLHYGSAVHATASTAARRSHSVLPTVLATSAPRPTIAAAGNRSFCSSETGTGASGPAGAAPTWGGSGYGNQSPIYGTKALPKGAEHGRCRALIYRSKQRGWLELDLLLGEFALNELPVNLERP
eukprot:SAG22_NODE_6114_length_896_cov_2.942284_2_plen_143_part_00